MPANEVLTGWVKGQAELLYEKWWKEKGKIDGEKTDGGKGGQMCVCLCVCASLS